MYSGNGSGAAPSRAILFSSCPVARVGSRQRKLRGVSSSRVKLPRLEHCIFPHCSRILKRSSVSLLLSSIMTALIILCVLCFLLECARSEEHTSELQSLTNLVCRLLLE